MWALPFVANRQKKFDVGSTIYDSHNSDFATPVISDTDAVLDSTDPGNSQAAREPSLTSIATTVPEWKRRMIAKNEAAKKEVMDIMDDSLKRVMAKTELKPEAQREQAVNSYISAVDWVMWSVNAVISRVK